MPFLQSTMILNLFVEIPIQINYLMRRPAHDQYSVDGVSYLHIHSNEFVMKSHDVLINIQGAHAMKQNTLCLFYLDDTSDISEQRIGLRNLGPKCKSKNQWRLLYQAFPMPIKPQISIICFLLTLHREKYSSENHAGKGFLNRTVFWLLFFDAFWVFPATTRAKFLAGVTSRIGFATLLSLLKV